MHHPKSLKPKKKQRPLPSSEQPMNFSPSPKQSFSKEECLSWSYYVPKEQWESETEWDLFNVLLIETDNAGISTRVGLEKVFQKAFKKGWAGKKV
jgi:hypothetical protein